MIEPPQERRSGAHRGHECFDLARTPPRELLAALAREDGAVRVVWVGGERSVLIDLDRGVVTGARAQGAGASPRGDGGAALRAFLDLDDGTAHVERRRFAELANLMRPVSRILSTGRSEQTRKIACRRDPVDSPERSWVLPLRRGEPAPAVVASSAAVGRLRHTLGWTFLLLFAAALVAVWMLWAGRSALSSAPAPEVVSPPAAGKVLPTAPSPSAVKADSDHTASADARGEHHRRVRERARQLALDARDELQEGDAARALELAERLVRLRPGVPYYHVLLGDARLANDRRAAARRSFRRALRLDPGYRAAEMRLFSLGERSPSQHAARKRPARSG